MLEPTPTSSSHATRCTTYPTLAPGSSPAHEGWTRQELETRLRHEHSTFNWLLEPMIEHAAFEIEYAGYGSLRIYAEYTCTKRIGGPDAAR